MKTWICTAIVSDEQVTRNIEAEDLPSASTACAEWVESIDGQFVSVQVVDSEIAARQAAIDKLVSSGLLTEEEATALAGG
jgi:hypothetical protein